MKYIHGAVLVVCLFFAAISYGMVQTATASQDIVDKIDLVCAKHNLKSIYKRLVVLLANNDCMQLLFLLDDDLLHQESADLTDVHIIFIKQSLNAMEIIPKPIPMKIINRLNLLMHEASEYAQSIDFQERLITCYHGRPKCEKRRFV